MVKVSVVIPVYNVEKYLNRCIDSLLKQSFKDFELILIDDGSSDNSFKIMSEYKSDNVRVYHQKNMGPAKTRNRGIKLARGTYIMFVDSDDYVLPNYINNYYSASLNGDFDLVIGGYQKINGENIDFVRRLHDGEFSKYLVTGPVCKLYRRSFLLDNNIKFLDTTASEDVYFNLLAYSKNPKIKVIDDIGYFYYYNSNSLSNTMHKGFNKDVDILGLVSEINYKDIDNVLLNQYFIIRYLIWYLLHSGKVVNSACFCNEYNKLFNWLGENIPNYRCNKYIRFCPKGEYLKIHLFIHIFILLDRFKLVKLFSLVYCKGDR